MAGLGKPSQRTYNSPGFYEIPGFGEETVGNQPSVPIDFVFPEVELSGGVLSEVVGALYSRVFIS